MMSIASGSDVKSSTRELILESYKNIQKGSKSFHFASLFLSRRIRQRAWFLYAWCRISDDLVDHAPTKRAALEYLDLLTFELDTLYNESRLPNVASESFKALPGINLLKNDVGLSVIYLKDMLRGYRMDVDGFIARPLHELLDYCYCVAGAVGLMMCQVMQVTDPRALEHAKNLGIAMQLTNIIRDIQEDLKLGRIYIPQEFFSNRGLNVSDLYSSPNKICLSAAHYLFELAEPFYMSGYHGLRYLPFRERLSISIAAVTYRQIGLEVLKRGDLAWTSRTYTSLFQKFTCAIRGLFLTIKMSF